MIEEITKDVAPGIVVQEGHLIELASGRLVKDFLQAVPMPETMRVMTFVEAPLGPRRGWRLGLLPGAFHPLDSRGTDRHLGDILEFPGQAFWTQPRLCLDQPAGFLLYLAREAPGGPTGSESFGEARQRAAMAQALNGAGRRRRRAGLGLDLCGTPGRMTLGQIYQGRFLGGRQPIGGALGTRAVICQGPLEGGERTAAPLIEDATPHAEAGGHVGDRLAPEEGQDRVKTVLLQLVSHDFALVLRIG